MKDTPPPIGCILAVLGFALVGSISSVAYGVLKLVDLIKFVVWGIR